MEIFNSDNQTLIIQREYFSPGKLAITDPEVHLSFVMILIISVIFFAHNPEENSILTSPGISNWIALNKIWPSILIFLFIFNIINSLLRKSKSILLPEKYIFDRHKNIFSNHNSNLCQEVCKLDEIRDINFLVELKDGILYRREDGFRVEIGGWADTNSTYKVILNFASGKALILEQNSINVFSKSETQTQFRNLIAKTNEAVKLMRLFLNLEADMSFSVSPF